MLSFLWTSWLARLGTEAIKQEKLDWVLGQLAHEVPEDETAICETGPGLVPGEAIMSVPVDGP